MEPDEWHPPAHATMPEGPDSFPARGVNSLATVGSRGLARVIDAVVLGVPVSIGLLIASLVASGGEPGPETLGSDQAWAWIWGVAIGLVCVYETLCVSLWGQTLGKLTAGVRVVRLSNGRCPLWWEAAIRIILPGAVAVIPDPLAKVVALALFTVAVADPMRRNLPDRAAGTVVVRSR